MMSVNENDDGQHVLTEGNLNLEPVVSNTAGRQSTILEGGALASSAAFPLSQTSPRGGADNN